MKKYLFAFAALAMLFACTAETADPNGEETIVDNNAPSVTVGADKISAISAVLKGKANLGSTVASDLTMGILWSENAGVLPSNSTKVEASNMDGKYNYSVEISRLEPATTYYYRSYVTQNGQDTYGETKEFKTKDISSAIQTQDAAAVSAVSAKLFATLDLTDIQYTKKDLGFYWGTSAESLRSKVSATEGNGTISADLSALNPSKQHFFQAYVSFDGKELKEAVKSFTTKGIETILETMDASGIEATTATLNAKLNLTDVKYSSIDDYGFYWTTSESSQNIYLKGRDIADNTFTSALSNLSHKTQYWYKAYLKLDNQDFYGEVKTFTTGVVKVESVSLDRNEYTFDTIGNIITLNPTVLPADATDKSVEWSSDNEDVATVDQSGTVTAKSDGTATITVTTKDQGKTASCTITVSHYQYVTEIKLNKAYLSLNEGANYTLTATVTPEDAVDKSLTWTSSDTAVATVDENGIVTAVSKGSATITAQANDGSGKKASCQLTVIRLVSSIQLSETSTIMFVNGNKYIKVTVSPADASNTSFNYSVSDPTLADVGTMTEIDTKTGTRTVYLSIFAKARGHVTVTATAVDGSGVSASCEVEIVSLL